MLSLGQRETEDSEILRLNQDLVFHHRHRSIISEILALKK